MNLRCFLMMQFQGEHQELLFQKIEQAINRFVRTSGYSIQLTRADLTAPLGLATLEEHLKTEIASADFVIAEISQLNPNVLFEMGYAFGLRKPVIILVQEGTQVPADFRGRLYFQYKKSDFDLIPQMLQDFIRSAVDSLLSRHFDTSYTVQAFSNRSVADLTRSLMDAKHTVDVLTTNLYSIVMSNYHQILADRLRRNPDLKVRVLTLDPESYFAQQRAKQIAMSTKTFRDQLRKSLGEILSLRDEFPDQCEVGIYDEFPTQIAFRIDNTVYINLMSASQQGRNNILFKLNETDAGVAGSILHHFDTLWSRSAKPERPSEPTSN